MIPTNACRLTLTIARRAAAVAVAVSGALMVVAPAADAVHWPFFGGESGRSGYQPLDDGTVPLTGVYAKTAATEQFVKSSIITSAGSPATQRLVFGTRTGFVNLQVLGSGEPVGPEAGIAVDEGIEDPDVFGTRSMLPGQNGASVSFVDTSTSAGLGQIFAVHNDDDAAPGAADIEIAQIDETTGTLIQQVDIAGTDGLTIQSSAVATGPDAGGARNVFFTANDGAGDSRLLKVAITAAGTTGAVITTTASAGDIDATPFASPSLASLSVDGTPTPHVLVGTTDGFVRSYRADTLVAGLASNHLGGPAQTPSGPVQPTGDAPNAATAVRTAPFVYAATEETGATQTMVHKLGGDLRQQLQSDLLDGAPAPALAVEQEAEVDQKEGKVIVTTGANLFTLNTADMSVGGRFSSTPLLPGSTGFRQTTAAASGDLIFVTNDAAQQLVLRLSDATPVARGLFTPDAANTGAPNTGVGQPSISRGYVQYSGGQGVFVYRTAPARRFTPLSVSARVTPARDRTAPHRFTTRGRLRRPSAVTAAQACAEGVVSVRVKAGPRTVSTRQATLRKNCTYSSTVTFRSRAGLGRSGRLTVTARFLGNDVLGPRSAAPRSARVR